jgi:glycine C-acetyltransferase
MPSISAFVGHARDTLAEIDRNRTRKCEIPLTSGQGGRIRIAGDGDAGRQVVNLSANNYLGLARHPAIVSAAKAALDEYGAGMASARFISGTHTLHTELEARLAAYLGKEAAILFCNGFAANLGLFEALLGPEDAIVSDALNHASIIDGMRLCKARRYRFASSDMNELEQRLREARQAGSRFVLIATDGVFSMDGFLADLPAIVALAETHGAIVVVDDCHAVGIVGPQGRGTAHHFGVVDGVHIVTGTFGKAFGGMMGGYIAGPRDVIELLRQRSRPYVFSNALPPADAAAALTALNIVEMADPLRRNLAEKTAYWRAGLEGLGFDLLPGNHPIVPVMVGDEALSQQMAEELLAEGVRVVGLQFPVVPVGEARIRTQVSSALDSLDLDRAAAAFGEIGRRLGLLRGRARG